MRLLLIGAPGAGKGTQAERLAERFNITHISSGDLLRQHVKDQTSIGQKIKAYVDAGDLVTPWSWTCCASRLSPRSNPAVTCWTAFPALWTRPRQRSRSLTRSAWRFRPVVHLDVPDEELIRRLLARSPGFDDTEEIIAHRLQVYREKTIPLLEYYAGREWMFTVDGTRSPDQVHQDIVGRLRKLAAFDTSEGHDTGHREDAESR
jgi:adenylate kinase